MPARGSIFDEMRRIHDEMDKLFNDFFSFSPVTARHLLPSKQETTDIVTSNYRTPLTDMWETDKEIIMNIELPGVDKKDISVEIRDNGVDVKVEKKEELKEENKKKGFYRLERTYTGFYRHIPLPDYADLSNIDASYNNGVLELKVPKKKESSKNNKKIKIK